MAEHNGKNRFWGNACRIDTLALTATIIIAFVGATWIIGNEISHTKLDLQSQLSSDHSAVMDKVESVHYELGTRISKVETKQDGMQDQLNSIKNWDFYAPPTSNPKGGQKLQEH